MNNQNPLEDIMKFAMLQNSKNRRLLELMSDMQTVMTAYNLHCKRNNYEYLAILASQSMLPFGNSNERHKLVKHCFNEVGKCDYELQQLIQDIVKDKAMSKLAKMKEQKRMM